MSLKTKSTSNSEVEKFLRPGKTGSRPPPEPGMYIQPTPVFCQQDQRRSVGQVIRSLRKEKGISQEELARGAQVDRTTIVRIECGIFKSISADRLERIAQAIGIDVKTLLLKIEPLSEPLGFRGHLNQPAFSLEYPEDGFKIISLTPKRKEFFFGRIEIGPQITIASSKLPHPEQIYLHCFDGKLLLTCREKEYLLKQGDCFIFSSSSDYEFYNSDPLKTASSLFITYPSFLLA